MRCKSENMTLGRTQVFTYASLADAVADATDAAEGRLTTVNGRQVKRLPEQLASMTDDRAWADGLTWGDALAGIGAPAEWKREAVARFDCGAYSAPLAPAPRRKVVKRLNDGDTIDAERFASEFTVEGVWSKRIRARVVRPVVRVLLNHGARCDVPAEQMARNAAATLAFIRIAEDSGYAVEADWGSTFVIGSRDTFAIRVRVKEVDQAMDWDTLVGLTVGGGTHRSLGFMLRNVCLPIEHWDYGSSQRKWYDAHEYDAASLGFMTSDEEARKWLTEACDRLSRLSTEGREAVAA